MRNAALASTPLGPLPGRQVARAHDVYQSPELVLRPIPRLFQRGPAGRVLLPAAWLSSRVLLLLSCVLYCFVLCSPVVFGFFLSQGDPFQGFMIMDGLDCREQGVGNKPQCARRTGAFRHHCRASKPNKAPSATNFCTRGSRRCRRRPSTCLSCNVSFS